MEAIWLAAPRSVPLLQLSQVFAGVLFSSIMLQQAYVFRTFERRRFQSVISGLRWALLCGTVLASVCGELMLDEAHAPLRSLFYVTLAAAALALLVGLLLRREHRPPPAAVAQQGGERAPLLSVQAPLEPKRRPHPVRTFAEMFHVYRSWNVLSWSAWAGTLLAVHTLVIVHWQTLLKAVNGATHGRTGYAVAGVYVAAALAALVPACVREQWKAALMPACLVLAPAFGACCVALMATATSRWTFFAVFMLFHSSVELSLAFVNVQIARNLAQPRYGLTTSLNALFSVGMQLTVQLVAAEAPFFVDIRRQFTLFACVLAGLSAMAAAGTACAALRCHAQQRRQQPPPRAASTETGGEA